MKPLESEQGFDFSKVLKKGNMMVIPFIIASYSVLPAVAKYSTVTWGPD